MAERRGRHGESIGRGRGVGAGEDDGGETSRRLDMGQSHRDMDGVKRAVRPWPGSGTIWHYAPTLCRARLAPPLPRAEHAAAAPLVRSPAPPRRGRRTVVNHPSLTETFLLMLYRLHEDRTLSCCIALRLFCESLNHCYRGMKFFFSFFFRNGMKFFFYITGGTVHAGFLLLLTYTLFMV
jgi:hypothetical protein